MFGIVKQVFAFLWTIIGILAIIQAIVSLVMILREYAYLFRTDPVAHKK